MKFEIIKYLDEEYAEIKYKSDVGKDAYVIVARKPKMSYA